MENKSQIVKQSFKEVQEELKEKKIDDLKNNVKESVKRTLLKLEEKQEERRKVVREIQILKMDIKDFKAGRLDKIVERQKQDSVAKETSVVKVEVEMGSNISRPWSQSFVISDDSDDLLVQYTATGFDFHNYSGGVYTLNNGIVKYL